MKRTPRYAMMTSLVAIMLATPASMSDIVITSIDHTPDVVYGKAPEIETEKIEFINTPETVEFVSTIQEMATQLELEEENSSTYPIVTKRSSYLGVSMLSHCSYTGEQLNLYLKRGLSGLGETFKRVEQETGVNAMFLIAISALESSHGTSDLARDYNNIFGYGAFDEDVRGNALQFSSYEECIRHVATKLKTDYLQESGQYYNGDTIEEVNILYCSKQNWKDKVDEIMVCIDKQIEEASI